MWFVAILILYDLLIISFASLSVSMEAAEKENSARQKEVIAAGCDHKRSNSLSQLQTALWLWLAFGDIQLLSVLWQCYLVCS